MMVAMLHLNGQLRTESLETYRKDIKNCWTDNKQECVFIRHGSSVEVVEEFCYLWVDKTIVLWLPGFAVVSSGLTSLERCFLVVASKGSSIVNVTRLRDVVIMHSKTEREMLLHWAVMRMIRWIFVCEIKGLFISCWIEAAVMNRINVKKTVVYLQLITAKWHIENSKKKQWTVILLQQHFTHLP